MTEARLVEMLENEIPLAAALSNKSWDYPFDEDDFRKMLEDEGHWVWLYRLPMDAVGLCAYCLKEQDLELLELSVRPRYRHKKSQEKFGYQMMRFVKQVAAEAGMLRITTIVRESDLTAQLWLQRQGLRATAIFHNYWEQMGGKEDGYLMSVGIDDIWKSEE